MVSVSFKSRARIYCSCSLSVKMETPNRSVSLSRPLFFKGRLGLTELCYVVLYALCLVLVSWVLYHSRSGNVCVSPPPAQFLLTRGGYYKDNVSSPYAGTNCSSNIAYISEISDEFIVYCDRPVSGLYIGRSGAPFVSPVFDQKLIDTFLNHFNISDIPPNRLAALKTREFCAYQLDLSQNNKGLMFCWDKNQTLVRLIYKNFIFNQPFLTKLKEFFLAAKVSSENL